MPAPITTVSPALQSYILNGAPAATTYQQPVVIQAQPAQDAFVSSPAIAPNPLEGQVVQNTTQGVAAEKPKTNWKKIALIGAAVAAATAGVYALVRKGKTMTMEEFKNVGGKLEKGVANIKKEGVDPKAYTGKLTTTNKAGTEVTLKYKKGLLVRSDAQKANGGELITKIFERNENGKIASVTKKIGDVEKVTEFGRDASGKLISRTEKVGDVVTTYAPDATGKWAKKAAEVAEGTGAAAGAATPAAEGAAKGAGEAGKGAGKGKGGAAAPATTEGGAKPATKKTGGGKTKGAEGATASATTEGGAKPATKGAGKGKGAEEAAQGGS